MPSLLKEETLGATLIAEEPEPPMPVLAFKNGERGLVAWPTLVVSMTEDLKLLGLALVFKNAKPRSKSEPWWSLTAEEPQLWTLPTPIVPY